MLLRIAVSGTHGVGKTTLVQKVAKKLKKIYPPELVIVENEYIRDEFREDIGENQTEEATAFYFNKADMLLRKGYGLTDGIIIYDRPWFDTIIYYVAAKVFNKRDEFETLGKKKNDFLKLHEFVYRSALHFATEYGYFPKNKYDIIVFNKLPDCQYEMSVPNDGLRLQTIAFRNVVNDVFKLFYQRRYFYNHNAKCLCSTRVVTNATPLGASASVERFIHTLINNEIMPSFHKNEELTPLRGALNPGGIIF